MNFSENILKRFKQDVTLRGGIVSAVATLLALVVLSFFIVQFLIYRLEGRVEDSLINRHTVASSILTKLSDSERTIVQNFRKTLPVKDEGVFSWVDKEGNFITGSVTGLDCREGFYDHWLDTTQSAVDGPLVPIPKIEATSTEHFRFRFLGQPRDDRCLVFGRSMYEVDAIKQSVMGLLVWLVPLCLLPALLISLRQSWNLRCRLLHMQDVVQSVSMGDFSSRITIKGEDDIDRLAFSANRSFDRLQDSVSTLQQLTTVIAHDLRSPLNRITIPLDQALRANEAGQPDVKSLEAVQQGLSDAQSVFEALLRISQIESGQRRSKFTNVDLYEIAESLYEIYQPVVEDVESCLEFEVNGEGTSVICGDSDLLRQALVNLIENAIRYTPKGSFIRICVSRDWTNPTLTVRDNGPGLPEEERPRVLQRLYRYEQSTGGKSGNGLGLSLVKAVSEAHNAELLIDDAKPGLLIRLIFPAANPADAT